YRGFPTPRAAALAAIRSRFGNRRYRRLGDLRHFHRMNTQICTGPLPAAGLSRRGFLNRFGMGLGGIALANLLSPTRLLASADANADRGILDGKLHHPAKAKRVIYLFMAGGPSQMETFDYKPLLNERNGE